MTGSTSTPASSKRAPPRRGQRVAVAPARPTRNPLGRATRRRLFHTRGLGLGLRLGSSSNYFPHHGSTQRFRRRTSCGCPSLTIVTSRGDVGPPQVGHNCPEPTPVSSMGPLRLIDMMQTASFARRCCRFIAARVWGTISHLCICTRRMRLSSRDGPLAERGRASAPRTYRQRQPVSR
jgi:hypothetical protein